MPGDVLTPFLLFVVVSAAQVLLVLPKPTFLLFVILSASAQDLFVVAPTPTNVLIPAAPVGVPHSL
jgi:hypothetical protein